MEAKRLVMLKEVPELENVEEENPILISAKESQDNDNDKKEGANKYYSNYHILLYWHSSYLAFQIIILSEIIIIN